MTHTGLAELSFNAFSFGFSPFNMLFKRSEILSVEPDIEAFVLLPGWMKADLKHVPNSHSDWTVFDSQTKYRTKVGDDFDITEIPLIIGEQFPQLGLNSKGFDRQGCIDSGTEAGNLILRCLICPGRAHGLRQIFGELIY